MVDVGEAGAAATSSGFYADEVADELADKFRLLVERADRKFARVRDLSPHGRGGPPLQDVYYRKVFKAYTELWHFQQEHRKELIAAGLRRSEIGDIASRIGQLYYGQYLRTSEERFLLGAYVFYEAILERGYFEAARGYADLGVRSKEIRFHARFLVVALLLNRMDAVRHLAGRFRALVDESRAAFLEISFKEWKKLLHEIVRFLDVDTEYITARPLRYNVLQDTHSFSLPYITRFHANRALKLQDALLTSYHRNEVKFAELTLDTFRMIQCLEWEPSRSFYKLPSNEPGENGGLDDQSGASGLIEINLPADMTDPTLPSNPRKAIIYHPSISHLIAVLAAICEEMSPDGILLVYVSASGKAEHSFSYKKDVPESSTSFKLDRAPKSSLRKDSLLAQPLPNDKLGSSSSAGNYIYLGPRGTRGANNLYPEDFVPFTRRPLFIIIDGDNSHAFKVLHGVEREEPSALLLSHEKPISISDTELASGGSQFTYFLTAPLQAFCQLVGLYSDIEVDAYDDAESLLASAFAYWEVELCTSESLDQVWAQVLSDPFLRRLILRFIFCRAVLSSLHPAEDGNQHMPECLPNLPESFSPNSALIQNHIQRLAEILGVENYFYL